MIQPSVPTAVRYTVEAWADDLVPDLPFVTTPTVVLSPGFSEDFRGSASWSTVEQRFHAGWDQAIGEGATLQHTIVPDARLLLWEDRPEEVLAALKDLAAP